MVSRRLRFALVALALVACLLPAVQAFAPHTDDGCQVEIHCLACRHALGATAALDVASPTHGLFAASAAAPVDLVAQEIVRPRSAAPARAPPALDQV